ncbi:MAG: GNAT family N-acetyltransferase [Alphaproteobacteria bacterium]|nr:GNAT family N-acetyltransferase [Alphaproteobacteria bacterium]
MNRFKPKEHLIGERIILLKREETHEEEMIEAINESRNELREYLFWVDGTKDLSDVKKATQMFKKQWEEDVEWAYDIYELDTHILLGSIGVHNIKFINRSAELGYWLRTSKTNQGYMKEAILILEKELFEHGIHRLTICCDVFNKKSSNTAIRAGYKLESVAKEAIYHYTGLHDIETYVKFSPYPLTGF